MTAARAPLAAVKRHAISTKWGAVEYAERGCGNPVHRSSTATRSQGTTARFGMAGRLNADRNHGCAGVSTPRISAMETAAIHKK
jgi:hypothetical protein